MFVRVDDFTADGYCSRCGGLLYEIVVEEGGVEVYPQVCESCGYGLRQFENEKEILKLMREELDAEQNSPA